MYLAGRNHHDEIYCFCGVLSTRIFPFLFIAVVTERDAMARSVSPFIVQLYYSIQSQQNLFLVSMCETAVMLQGTKIFQHCTCPAGPVTYNFHLSCKHMQLSYKSVCSKEHKGLICNMTSSSDSSQSTDPTG